MESPPPVAAWVDRWAPRSVLALRSYNVRAFGSDLVAGITVGLVALPLAMAFAISSGVKPEAGLYCAIIAGFVAALLGGSNFQVTGPTGAFVVVVSGIVASKGLDGLFMCTLMAGVMLIGLGMTGLGSAVKFIPRPVVMGFTNGISLLIASTQVKDFFGLQMEKVPGDFMGRMLACIRAWPTVSYSALAVSSLGLLVMVLILRYRPKIPGAVLVLVAGTAAAWALHLSIETIETKFGGIPSGLPHVVVPAFAPSLIPGLLAPAVTVAMLGAIESLMSAVVADKMGGDRHNPNVELIGQGFANVLSPLMGGLPATGAIARTATNIRSGARTPMAAMIHALMLVLILVFAAPLAKHIPLAVLAAILMMVAWNMGEWKEVPAVLRLSRADAVVWLITFLLTVFADLTVAVQAGMILAALLYIQRVTTTTTVSLVTEDYLEAGRDHILTGREIPDGAVVYRIHGPFLFGSTDKLEEVTKDLSRLPPVVILRLRNMTAIDGTGVHALEELAKTLEKSGRHVIFCGMRDQPGRLLRRAGFAEHVGEANICPNVSSALSRATELLAQRKDPWPAR